MSTEESQKNAEIVQVKSDIKIFIESYASEQRFTNLKVCRNVIPTLMWIRDIRHIYSNLRSRNVVT